MDLNLRCNSLKCRTLLSSRAIVTTCSHVFCVNCSDSLGLSNNTGNERICPACETRLVNPDDVVATALNPSEDYKTSVLSGLSPSIIMECAGRGLAFYCYQATQEVVYQEYLVKSLSEKHDGLSSQLDQIIHDANSEIVTLRNKLSALEMDQDALRRKNESLQEAYAEKTRQYQKSQLTYDRLKKRMLESDVQYAAESAVEQGLHSNTTRSPRMHGPGSVRASRGVQLFHTDASGVEQIHPRQKSGSSEPRDNTLRSFQPSHFHTHNQTSNFQGRHGVSPTGSNHRTRLPVPVVQSDRDESQLHLQNSSTFQNARLSPMSAKPNYPWRRDDQSAGQRRPLEPLGSTTLVDEGRQQRQPFNRGDYVPCRQLQLSSATRR